MQTHPAIQQNIR